MKVNRTKLPDEAFENDAFAEPKIPALSALTDESRARFDARIERGKEIVRKTQAKRPS